MQFRSDQLQRSLTRVLIVAGFAGSYSLAEAESLSGNAAALSADLGELYEFTHRVVEYYRYQVDISDRAGYLIVVDQAGFDFVVTVEKPDGTSTTFDSPLLRDGPEIIYLSDVSPGTYSVAVSAKENTDAAGGHSFRFLKLDSAESSPEAGAWLTMSEAASAYASGGREGRQAAWQSYQRAADLWESLGRPYEQALATYCAASIDYLYQDEWRRAGDLSSVAANLFRQTGNMRLATNAQMLTAAAILEQTDYPGVGNPSTSFPENRFEAALSLFTASLDAHARMGNQFEAAQAINYIGIIHLQSENWPLAKEYFERAAEALLQLGEWSEALNPLSNIGVIDFRQGRLAKAVESYKRLLQEMGDRSDPAWKADTLDNLGASQLALGQIDDALASFSSALVIHRQVGSNKGVGRSLTGIASTYYSIGETELAIKEFLGALEVREESRDVPGQAAVLRFLGDASRRMGEFHKAVEYHERAIELEKMPAAEAKNQVLLARDYIAMGEFTRARTVLDKAEQLTTRTDALPTIADINYEIGRLSILINEPEGAENRLMRARNIYRYLGLIDGQAQCHLALARLFLGDDIEKAVQEAMLSVELIETLRSRIASPSRRAVYLATRRHHYDFVISTLMHARDTTIDPDLADTYLRRALTMSERARARATVDLMNEATVNLERVDAADSNEEQHRLYDILSELQYRQDRLVQTIEQPKEEESIADALAELESVARQLQQTYARIDVLEIESRRTDPRLAALKRPRILDADGIQGQLNVDSVLLQYWLGQEGSYLWVVTRDSISGFEIGDRDTVENLARRVHEEISSPALPGDDLNRLERLVDQLSAEVIGPADGQIRERSRVLLSADGALQYVPFGLLRLATGKSLLETAQLFVVSSMSAASIQDDIRGTRMPPTKTLAAIGDPVFSYSDTRAITSNRKDRAITAASSEYAVFSVESVELSRLPFSASEVARISDLVPDDQRLVSTGFAANKAGVTGDSLADYKYVHFATHGIINTVNPAMSTLVFSRWDSAGARTDSDLRLYDIYNMELRADIVVLSACETGLGREIRGEGLLGLTQGFMYAGAKGVVASLWKVSDSATAELMARFYQNLFAGDQSPAEALRDAQLSLAAERRWRDPFYWSGFVLHGDWT